MIFKGRIAFKKIILCQSKVLNFLLNSSWAVLNSLFTVGGMIGALGSKYLMDLLGRRYAMIAHNAVSIVAAILVLIAPYAHSPVCLILSRFLFGVQSGATCSIAPTYLNEITPTNLRGRTGVLPQLGIVFGILVAQILGFKEILGTNSLWHILLALPCVPALLCNICLLFFFTDTPVELVKEDALEAKKVLQKLRGIDDVNDELQAIVDEVKANENIKAMSLLQLFTTREYRWPLIMAFTLQVGQQLSGINAVIFFIWKNSVLVLLL